MSLFFIILGVSIAITVGIALLCAAAHFLIEDEPLIALGFLFAFLTYVSAFFAIAIAVTDEGGSAEHRWEGGRGPETKCWYESNQHVRMVGKVPVTRTITETVCR